jgi:TonB family protein
VRRARAHSQLFAWTVVLHLALAMPLLAAVLPDVPVAVVFSDPVIVIPGRGDNSVGPLPQAEAGVPASQPPSALPWLLAIYLAGTGFLITRIVAGARLSARVLRRAQPVRDAALVAEVQALSSAMRWPRVPRVVQHESVRVPFVCGVFRPALVLPDVWTAWDAATRHAVLTHELSHIVRRDLWTMRAALAYCAVTWMNPLSWWLRRKLETLAERASDDEVLASGVEPTAYAEMLVRFFDAAQRAPGRANWQLAMARRGGVEAQRRVGRVLNASEGGNVRFGMAGRVLVGASVVLAAVPVIVVSASRFDAVAIRGLGLRQAQAAPSTWRGENQAALRPLAVSPTRQQIMQPTVDVVKAASPKVPDVTVIPQVQEQEQEPEPWHSTRRAIDADVAAPQATIRVDPKYTPDAMRAQIQGMVAIEVIVSPEGEVSAVRVTRSLDTEFGLDEEAVKAARQWKFLPGTYQGQPLPVRAMIEMEFRLH